MSEPRPDLVVSGQVVVRAGADGLTTAEAIGIADGRVRVAGTRADVLAAAAPGAQHVDAERRAVVPGLCDFHLHLVGLARLRLAVDFDAARSFDEVLTLVRAANERLAPGAWLTGRGWSEATLEPARLAELRDVVTGRPAYLTSHDGHSAWASPAALAIAGVGSQASDPPGGRLERSGDGTPNGVLRERAMDLVDAVVERPTGDALRGALDETLAELVGLGITASTDAGDATGAAGRGPYADLGDSFSTLHELRDLIDGRLRLTLNIPAATIGAAQAHGLRSGSPMGSMLRVGWAKGYADGALGSGTAALFAPDTCGGDGGILRLEPDTLDELLAAGRRAGISLAIHAIGDRANATVLDALERSLRASRPVLRHRVEHAQLLRRQELPRFSALGVTASMQPIHAAADRRRATACWSDRLDGAYAWRGLSQAGALLAFGSDAPVESVNPWLGCFAAVHRRLPDDAAPDWTPDQRLDMIEALAAYTLGPARASGRDDEGHLGPGAVADLAVLNVDLGALLAGDERLAEVRSELTLVGGREVHRS